MILNYVKRQIKRIEGSLGRIIATRRALMGMTQEEFAERTGIGISTLKDIERGVSGGSPKVRAAIAKTLRCSVDDLSISPDRGEEEGPDIIRGLMKTVAENPIPPAVWFAWHQAEEWQQAVAMYFLTGKEFHLDRAVPEELRRRLMEGLRFHKMTPGKSHFSKK